ncbi:hypothetical protein Agub_g5193 [Astrephomene gubernaculifera]|uniref:Uncharacterized protein n=1 Tax=Astrephomene gubernaculifera TaxID=47775 RepID=A0AAD3DLH6_9CHLO|nr:hypothetical protein Agub_g5193 [Astrephomene gubernaculifera]
MSGPSPIRIVLWNDGGEGLASGVEDEAQQGVLRSFANLISEVIDSVLGLPQFRHVEAVEAEDAAEDGAPTLSIGFDSAGADSQVDLDKLRGQLDIAGLLLGTAKLPEELASVAEVAVTDEEEGATELQFSDEALVKDVSSIIKRARLERRYNSWFQNVADDLVPALDAASADKELTETPMDPFDVVQAIIAQLVRVAGLSPPRPNLLQRGGMLIGGVLGVPRAALRQVTKRLGRAQQLWWRLEDVALDGSRAAAKLAVRAARPLVIGFVLHRALRTLDNSRSLDARLSRLPPQQAEQEYYSALLGPDWQQQMQADMDKACQDVQEGLITDDINEEKRLMTAAQLRRLEVEEWDKQRMKNFYLSSFGGLKWFADMEQQLHNPLFIESRGWTDPVENWVGRNRTYPGDLPSGQYMSGDVAQAALQLKEAELGRPLSREEVARVLTRGAEMTGGLLAAGGRRDAGMAAALAAGGAVVPRKAK